VSEACERTYVIGALPADPSEARSAVSEACEGTNVIGLSRTEGQADPSEARSAVSEACGPTTGIVLDHPVRAKVGRR
jgi:hypothetical protein